MTFRLYLMSLLTSCFLLCGCQEMDIIPPSPQISFYPKQGDTSIFFCFDGSSSTDNMSEIWQLQFRWDFNSDGIWDTEWSRETKAVNKFSKFGKDSVHLQVKDNAGLVGIISCMVRIAPIFNDTLFMDSRDGNNYRAVRIDQLWWMAENLRFGEEISMGAIPKDDGIVEKFVYRDSLNQLKTESGYYNWNETTYYGTSMVRGICPEGWRLITEPDAHYLYVRFCFYGDINYYFQKGGYVGIDLIPEGLYSFFNKGFSNFGENGFWLVSQKNTGFMTDHYILNYTTQNGGGYSVWYSIPRDEKSFPPWWDQSRLGGKMDFTKLGVNVRCVKNISD
jgi:uncharacterized protein (TIGR02145 family)